MLVHTLQQHLGTAGQITPTCGTCQSVTVTQWGHFPLCHLPGLNLTCVMRPVELVTARLSGSVMIAHTHCVMVVPGRGLLFWASSVSVVL